MKRQIITIMLVLLLACSACSSKNDNSSDATQSTGISSPGTNSTGTNSTGSEDNNVTNASDGSNNGDSAPQIGSGGESGSYGDYEVTENDLIAEGFKRTTQSEAETPALENIIAVLTGGNDSTTDYIESAEALSWLNISNVGSSDGSSVGDFDSSNDNDAYIGSYSIVPFDSENWPDEHGMVLLDWRSEMSAEDLAMMDQMEDYNPAQDTQSQNSALLSRLPQLPDTYDSVAEMDGVLLVTISSMTLEQARNFFEACKKNAGFNIGAEELDLSAYGMGYMWQSSHPDGSSLTLQLNNNTLQIILEP